MMMAKDEGDRPNNSARKRADNVEYLVTLDPDGRHWRVTRGDQAIGAFARDKSTAVGLGYREASQEMAETGGQVSVWSVQGGKRTKEWPG